MLPYTVYLTPYSMLIIYGHLWIIEAMDEQLGVVELLPDGFVQRVVELRDDVTHLDLVCPPVLHRVQRHRRGRHGEAQLAPVCAGLQLEAARPLGFGVCTLYLARKPELAR